MQTSTHKLSANAAPFDPSSLNKTANTAASVEVKTNATGQPSSNQKDKLSALANPWSPDTAISTEKSISVPAAAAVDIVFQGSTLKAPAPILKGDTDCNAFVHCFIRSVQQHPGIKLEFYNYSCGLCPLKSIFGRLSSRRADLCLKNVPMDVPPLCVAHLVERMTNSPVLAIAVSGSDNGQYDLWFEKAGATAPSVQSMSSIWMCPFFHGFAVYPLNANSAAFLQQHLKNLSDLGVIASDIYPLSFVEAKKI